MALPGFDGAIVLEGRFGVGTSPGTKISVTVGEGRDMGAFLGGCRVGRHP